MKRQHNSDISLIMMYKYDTCIKYGVYLIC